MLRYLISSMRPRQWTKNLVVFAGLIFSQNFFNLSLFLKASGAFLIFCIASGGGYVLNDIIDLKQDRKHPLKSLRALASGRLSSRTAFLYSILCFGLSSILALFLSLNFFYFILIYISLSVFYSILFKRIVILDVLSLAMGFVLRAVAGGVVISVEISSWLLICTILLALFLGLGKRRHELVILENGASEHREILSEYSPYLLDQMIAVVTASTVVAYALYTMSQETVEKFHTKNLEFTIPFVLYGIFRYLYLIHQKSAGGSPERLLISDKPLIIDIILWILVVGLILYR